VVVVVDVDVEVVGALGVATAGVLDDVPSLPSSEHAATATAAVLARKVRREIAVMARQSARYQE